jgi:hypothetical protein
MAVVNRVYTLEFFIEDRKLKPSLISIPVGTVGSDMSLDHLIDTADALELILDPLVSGDIRRASVSIDLYTNPPGEPDAGSNINQGILAVIAPYGTEDHELWRMPCVKDGLLGESGITLDSGLPEVSDLYTLFQDGIEVGEISFVVVNTQGEPSSIRNATIDYQLTRYGRRR